MKKSIVSIVILLAALAAQLAGEAAPAAADAPILTGIHNIQEFLERCPTNDPAYSQIRQDFDLRLDGQVISQPITCSEPFSTLPITQLTDALVAEQVLRTAFYMSAGTEGRLPWTSKSLYDWMKGNIGGINFKTQSGLLYCCDYIDNKYYISTSLQDDSTRNWKRTWPGLAGSLAFYVHEIRHRDPGAPGHVTGCPTFPNPTDQPGCDPTYDLSNLGSYGTQYWLYSQWATGGINIGIGCALPEVAQQYAMSNAADASGFIGRFVTNPPPVVNAYPPYGGTCVSLSPGGYLPLVLR